VTQPHVGEMPGTPRAFEQVVPRHVAPVSLLLGLHRGGANSRQGRVKPCAIAATRYEVLCRASSTMLSPGPIRWI